jgi:carboxyl-terminal processing protease
MISWLLLCSLLSLAPAAGDRATYDRAMRRIQDHYLRVGEFDPAVAFAEAAEAAEDAIPWLIVETQDGVATLRHGDRGLVARVTLRADGAPFASKSPQAQTEGAAALPAALERLEDAIRQAKAPLPDDVDLPIELLRGVTRALDRHSVVLAGQRLEKFDERIKGTLSGIGATIGRLDGDLVVKAVFHGSPAEIAGLRVGDVVVRVDGISTLGMSVTDVVDRIRGERDTSVTLRIRRLQGGKPLESDLRLLRAEIAIPNVVWSMRPSGVGLIVIDHFSEQTVQLVKQAVNELNDAPPGSKQPRLQGLVIDLRGNGGGSMIQAANTADVFVDSGLILRTVGRNGERVQNLVPEMRAHGAELEPEVPPLLHEVPLVVLMDRDSASASEILGGALQLLGRGLLIGERSHGKGTVQKAYDIRSSASSDQEPARIKLTVAQYLLAEDTLVEESQGLVPDVHLQMLQFSATGVALSPHTSAGAAVAVRAVNELSGWRSTPPPKQSEDPLLTLGERIVLGAETPARSDLLASAEREGAALELTEEKRLVDLFELRGLDWRPADADYCRDRWSGAATCGPPELAVRVTVVDPPVAGSIVELRAEVLNRGSAPLYQAAVRLTAASPSLPWHELTLPIGFLPPGEAAQGSVLVALPVDAADREDLVTVTVEADERPNTGVEPVILRIRSLDIPPVDVTARLVAVDAGYRAEVEVRNLGTRNLTELRASFDHPEDSTIELTQREAMVPVLAPGTTTRLDLGLTVDGVRAPQADAPLALKLRLDAELVGRVATLPLLLPLDGSPVSAQAPRVLAQVPTALPLGSWPLSVVTTDESGIEQVTVWWNREKVAWHAGGGERFELRVPIVVGPSTGVVTVEARDVGGAVTRRRWYVRGLAPGDGTASQP